MLLPSGLAMNSSIVHDLDVVSSTKDTINLRWNVEDNYEQHVQGFKVRYQAVGSTVVQWSHLLTSSVTKYEIVQLHENTYYDICVQVYTNMTNIEPDSPCVQATTATDSLSVALGSTFGAFLALGVIVFFVFLAKWTHQRKLRKQLAKIPPSGDSSESLEKLEGEADIEMSDVSQQVHDETVKLEMGDPSTEGAVANGVQPGGQSNHVISDNETAEISRDKAIPSTSSGSSQENKQETTAESALLLPPNSSPTDQVSAVKTERTDRPPDVRPKTTKQNRPLGDLTHAYQNKPNRSSQRDRERAVRERERERDRDRRQSLRQKEEPGLRSNQSCPSW